MKILFVDENTEQLNGLKKLLAEDSDRWDLSFAEDGITALNLLREQPFEVVVTEIDMPIIDGSPFLVLVREKHPSVIRIVFSACTDQRKILKTAQSAHRYIPKPCAPATLRRTIENTLYIYVVLDNQAIRKVLIQTTSLPSIPSAYTKLMERIDDPEFSIQDAGEIIAGDVGLTVNILKQVNQFGLAHSISDIHQAVSLLGLDVIRAIALTTHIFHSIGDVAIPHFSIAELLEESMLTAHAAKLIIQLENGTKDDADCAFISGMLHQLGTLVFVVNFPDKYAAVLDRVYSANRPLIQVEKNLIGISHPEIGAHLLALWGMPESILNGVAFYREPAVVCEPNVGITTAVYAAYHIALQILGKPDNRECIGMLHSEPYSSRTDSFLIERNLTDNYQIWLQKSIELYAGIHHGK